MMSPAIQLSTMTSFIDDAAPCRVRVGRRQMGFADFAMIGFVLIIAILHLASATFYPSAASSLETGTAIVGP